MEKLQFLRSLIVSQKKEWDIKLKALFLGAVFLIDFVLFENKGNN